MTPDTLYNDLKAIAVAGYKNDRIKELRDKEQINRETAAEDVKKQIDSYTNAEGTGTFDVIQKKRKDMLVQLSGNDQIMKLYKAGRLDIDKILDDYKKEGDDAKIMTSILGYSAEDQRKMQEDYQKEFMDSIPRTDPVTYAEKMREFSNIMGINNKYPWINKKNFGELYKAYKDNPEELAKKANELRPTIPSTYLVNTNGFETDKDLLSKEVEALPDASGSIQSAKFVDAYAEEKKKLESKYNNPDELKKLFNSWNNYDKTNDTLSTVTDALTGGFFTNKMFHAWEKLANGNVPKDGWFSKDGTWLGYAASPDFEAYAKSHPEMGYKYVGPTTNKFLDLMDSVNEMAGEYAGARFGVNPNTIRDGLTGAAGLGNKTNYDKASGVLGGPKDDSEDSTNITDAFNPMALMMGGGGGKDDDMKGETNLKKNNKPRVNSTTRKTSGRMPFSNLKFRGK
jgi:hypothetical protein